MFEVTLEPAIEGAVADSFDGEEQRPRGDFAWMKFGLGVLFNFGHRIIYTAEQFGDKVLGGHESSLLRFGFGQPKHLEAKS